MNLLCAVCKTPLEVTIINDVVPDTVMCPDCGLENYKSELRSDLSKTHNWSHDSVIKQFNRCFDDSNPDRKALYRQATLDVIWELS